MRLHLALLVALACIPNAACADDPSSTPSDEYRYGAAEMEAACVGNYTGTLTLTGKAPTDVVLRLDRAPPGVKPACGNRVLCVATSELGVAGKLTTQDGSYKDSPVTGSLRVYGTELSGGGLDLTFGESLVLNLPMTSGKLGTMTNVMNNGSMVGTITLIRGL